MSTKILSHQHGVGLVEVLVAVLLLAVAVLGFSALQVRAVSATDESLVRTKSLTLVRNLAEVMRAYPDAYVTGSGTTFVKALPTVSGAIPIVQAVTTSPVLAEESSDTAVNVDGSAISISGTNNCLSTTTTTDNGKVVAAKPCSVNQLAARDVLLVKKIALEENIRIAAVTCPGTTAQAIQQQICVIAAWNDTKAILDNTDVAACATTDGVYKTSSQCLISEAY